jgi:hypothetical protein
MKAATPKQLELTAGKTREELLLATAPHIDPESAALQASTEIVGNIEMAEAATAVLGRSAPLAQCGPPEEDQDFYDFDWNTSDSVVLQSQPATAIYFNPKGCIVIRQERSWCQDDDPYVVITPENAVQFMEALAKRARE